MQILEADFILTCNEEFDILSNGAICFDDKIIELGSVDTLQKKYPNALCKKLPKNSVIMPGLINVHTHLEFSANKTILEYGSFISWLNSVIKYREELNALCDKETIDETIMTMIQTGTTSIGAISSYGGDLEACVNSKMRVVYFNEILGSRPDSVDILFGDFKHRLRHSQEKQNARFISALSIHSPYSTHPVLAKNALDIARRENLIVSTHFMESKAEREWIDSGKGEFLEFFQNFSPYAKPFTTGLAYLELFKGCKTLFTHGVHANDTELTYIKQNGGVLTHCPRSNRLLGVGLLNLENITNKQLPLTLGTDGLSSNNSVSLWDEMRVALFSHTSIGLTELAKKLLLSTTRNAAQSLGLPCGELIKDKEADIITLQMPQTVKNKKQIPLQSILHTNRVTDVYIQGESIEFH